MTERLSNEDVRTRLRILENTLARGGPQTEALLDLLDAHRERDEALPVLEAARELARLSSKLDELVNDSSCTEEFYEDARLAFIGARKVVEQCIREFDAARAERAESALAEMGKCYSDVESERQETVKQLLKAKRELAELYDLATTLTGEATEFWSIKAQVLCQKINDCAARAAAKDGGGAQCLSGQGDAMSGLARKRGAALRTARALRTAQAYRVEVTVETLRGHLVELEVVLRDLTLSGSASNEDLGAELLKAAGRVAQNAAALDRACQRIASMPPPAVRRRPPA